MAVTAQTIFAVAACLCAAVAGSCAWSLAEERSQRRRRRDALMVLGDLGGSSGSGGSALSEGDGSEGVGALGAWALALAERTSRGIEAGRMRRLLPRYAAAPDRFLRNVALAGSQDELSYDGYREARSRLTAAGAAAGAFGGAMFSGELAVLLAGTGAIFGWQLLSGALRARAAWRSQDLERRLPEMLDVLAMGMRSGLSFDGALALYDRYFDTALARAFRSAQRQWSCGLVRREEALRAIAATYDSFLLRRVVDNVVRSLRFGTALTDGLEDVAREARAEHKAHRQERVAKVPIKMMIPTGALMLPAMLILVLGPVLLELAGSL